MPRTDGEIEKYVQIAENAEPSDFTFVDADDLREIAEAVDVVSAANERIRVAVQTARANQKSWGEIGLALGVSRQAARERFKDRVNA